MKNSWLPNIITLTAIVGAYILLKKSKRSSVPSLVNNNNTTYMSNPTLPRGYRNNNPLNIRYSNVNNWLGKITNNTDGAFEQFITMPYGYRAALVLLRGKGYINGGINTIRKIITKFAPATENNTDGYIANVSRITGIEPDAVISRNDRDALTRIVYAMSIVENGRVDKDGNDLMTTYGLPDMDAINAGWNLL